MCDTGIISQINMAACVAVVLPVHVEDDHWAAVGVFPSLSSIIVANSIAGCTGHLREDVNMLIRGKFCASLVSSTHIATEYYAVAGRSTACAKQEYHSNDPTQMTVVYTAYSL